MISGYLNTSSPVALSPLEGQGMSWMPSRKDSALALALCLLLLDTLVRLSLRLMSRPISLIRSWNLLPSSQCSRWPELVKMFSSCPAFSQLHSRRAFTCSESSSVSPASQAATMLSRSLGRDVTISCMSPMEGLRVPCLARSQTIPTEQEGGSTLLLLTWREIIQTYWCDTLMDSGLKHTQGA